MTEPSNNIGINVAANINDAIFSGAVDALAQAGRIHPAGRLAGYGLDLLHGYSTSALTSQGFNGSTLASAGASFGLGLIGGLAFGPAGVAVGSFVGSYLGNTLYNYYENGTFGDLGELAELASEAGEAIANSLGDLFNPDPGQNSSSPSMNDIMDNLQDSLNDIYPGLGDSLADIANQVGEFIEDPFKFLPDFAQPPTDPFIIDLDGDGIGLISASTSNVQFDIDADGFREQTGWFDADDGLVFIDHNNNGLADDITELLGSQNLDAFSDLATYDLNNDGVIDASDAIYSELLVWQDINSNGLSENGEIYSLSDLGIKSISLNNQLSNTAVNGNIIHSTGIVSFDDGSFSSSYAVFLGVEQSNSSFIVPENFTYDERVLKLPTIKGNGNIANLDYAMSVDESLLNLVTTLITSSYNLNANDFHDQVEQIIFKWTDTENIASDLRGSNVDSKHLAVLEAFNGSVFQDQSPNTRVGEWLEASYEELVNDVMARLVVQTHNYWAANLVSEGAEIPPNHPLSAFSKFFYIDTTDSLVGSSAEYFAWISELENENQTADDIFFDTLDFAKVVFGSLYSNDIDALTASIDSANNSSNISSLNYNGSALAFLLLEANAIGSIESETITGTDGNDNFVGREGNDTLIGGNGSDTYVYTLGDGNDLISDLQSATYETDKLVLHGVDPADVSLSRSSSDQDDLILTLLDGSTIELNEYFWGYGQSIEEIIFDDGTIWTNSDLRTMYIEQSQTSGDDTINGFNTDDEITGGLGNDTLLGGNGSDTYVYTLGDGNDLISDLQSATYETDKLVLHGVDPADVSLSRSSSDQDDLILTLLDGSTIELNEYFWGYGQSIEEIIFDDGTIWTNSDLRTMYIEQIQTSGDDTINGFNADDEITGGLGNDTLLGGNGSDTYIYNLGDGNDVITDAQLASYETDTLTLNGILIADIALSVSTTDSDDLILTISDGATITIEGQLSDYYGQALEQIVFDDGTVWDRAAIESALSGGGTEPENIIHGTSGDDTIAGTSEDENFEGGLGDDTISGSTGDDHYLYNSGDGNDLIKELYYHSGTDQLVFKDLNESDVTFSIDHSDFDDVLVTVNATGETIKLDEQLYSDNAGVEKIKFSDGSILTMDRASVREFAKLRGTDGDDTIGGNSSRHVYEGGLGDDTLSGSSGHDSYHYASGDGNDLIKELYYHSGTDQLVFKDLNESDLTFSVDHSDFDDVLVTVNATGETIKLDEQLYSDNGGVEEIEFADGSTLTMDRTSVREFAKLRGTDGDDTIGGNSSRHVYEGGLGDDTLSGSTGDDSYHYASGDGNDLIKELYYHSGMDQLVFTDLNESDLSFSQSATDADDFIITINSTGETITLDEQLYSDNGGIEEIVYSDGTVFAATLAAMNDLITV